MKKNGKFVLVLAIIMIALCGTAAAELPPMYAGVDLGVGMSPASVKETTGYVGDINVFMAGFEMTPYFGINPVSMVPDLSFEFDLQMDFLKYYSGYGDFNYSVITPQLFAVYTYSGWKIKPFIGLGMGVNIINLDKYVYSEYYNTVGGTPVDPYNAENTASFSFAVKGGIQYQIPNTGINLALGLRYNVNSPTVKAGPYSFNVNMGSISINFGALYRF